MEKIDLSTIPKPPRHPSPGAKELLREFHWVRLLVGLVFLVLGAVMVVTTGLGRGIGGDVLLEFSGELVDGMVESTAINHGMRFNRRHPTVFAFTYEVDGVRYRETSSTTNPGTVAKYLAGTPARVEVLKSVPRVARLLGTSRSPLGYTGAMVFLGPLLGAWFVINYRRKTRSTLATYRDGHPAVAEVTDRGARGFRINGVKPYIIRWRFTVGRKVYFGSVSHMDRKKLEALCVDNQIAVLYDRTNPRRNTVWAA